MLNWWSRRFRGATPSDSRSAAKAPIRPASATPARRPSAAATGDSAESPLTERDVEFLDGLVNPPAAKHLDDLEKADRLFLGGIVKRLHARQLDIPIFPETAIRLSELLRESDVAVSRYVVLLNADPATSVEVLKIANSPFYGAARKTTSLNEAIMRVGLARLQSILLLTHLKARVLKTGSLQRQAELLLELAVPMGLLANRFARQTAGATDLRFMRGMLMHVEHLVILGTITDISKEHRSHVAPSTHGVHQAFDRFGPDIREAIAVAWQLQDILLGNGSEGDADQYSGLRGALVCCWLDRPLPPVAGVDAQDLAEALSSIPPRVKPPDESHAMTA